MKNKTHAFNRAAAFSLSASLLVSLLAGCGSSPPAAQDSASGSAPAQSSASSAAQSSSAASEKPAASDGKPVPIRIFNRLNPEVQVDDNPLLAELETKFNVKIEYEAPPINNYLDKLQITMASGDLPDLLYNWGGADVNYEQWAKSGLLAELDDRLDQYPNLQKNIAPDMYEAMRSTITGKIHCVPKTNMVNYWGFLVNKKWMAKLNLQTPKTLDEFTEVFRAISTQDPDGDGKQNTFGISSTENTTRISITPLMNAFGLKHGIPDRDGTYKIIEKMSGYIPYLTYLHDLYAEKLLDPEFFTNKYNMDSEKRRSDIVGMTVCHQGSLLGGLKDQPDALERYSYIPGPVDVETGKLMNYNDLPIWGGYMISADSKYIDKCLELLDYGNSPEGFELMSIGLQGEHFNSYEFGARMVDRTPEQAGEYAKYGSSYFTFAFAMDGMPCIIENGDTQERVDIFHAAFDPVKASTEMVMTPSINVAEYKNWASEHPDLAKKYQEQEVKYVVGEITLEAFQSFLNTEYYPAWEEAEAAYVAWMKARG